MGKLSKLKARLEAGQFVSMAEKRRLEWFIKEAEEKENECIHDPQDLQETGDRGDQRKS